MSKPETKDPEKSKISGVGIVCTGLYNLFTEPMILQWYRGNIIGYDLRIAQPSYSLVTILIGCSIAVVFSLQDIGRCLGSYLLWGCLESYVLGECLESYFTLPTISQILQSGFLLLCFLFPIIGLAHTGGAAKSSDGNYDLTDFDPDPESDDRQEESIVKSAIRRAYGYVRQSQTDEDEGESSSIQSQKNTSTEVAKEHDYSGLMFFEDVNESGFSFEREGFQNLLEALEREPKPIFLDRVDRLGRDTLETIYVAAEIHYEYEVPIITAQHGRYDLDKIDDQLNLVLNAIIAGKSVKNRVRAAWKSIIMRFGEERKWYTWFDKVPVGYQLDGDEWIEPAEYATDVIKAIGYDLLESENRAETARRIGRKAKNESVSSTDSSGTPSLASIEGEKLRSVFDKSDYDPEDFDGAQLKRLLTNSTLIGDVRYPRNAPYEEQSSIEDSNLKTVGEEFFNRINTFIEETAEKYSTNTSNNVDMETLADHGLLLISVDILETIKPVCPECNRGMVQNGEDNKHPLPDGRIAHYWICPKYNEEEEDTDCQRKIPHNKEWELLKEHLDDEYTDFSDVVLLKICPPKD